MRDGRPKYPEPGTGPLAFDLARQLSASAIATAGELETDPNWDDPHPYLTEIRKMEPDVVVDLHQMRPRGFDVCLGAGSDARLSERLWSDLARRFVQAGFTVTINYPFSGGPKTITSRLQQIQISAVQIELSSDLFYERERGYLRDALVSALLSFGTSEVERIKNGEGP